MIVGQMGGCAFDVVRWRSGVVVDDDLWRLMGDFVVLQMSIHKYDGWIIDGYAAK